jgi:GT2 family glycosyltransferase
MIDIHVCTPYSLDKNLGRAYNLAASRVPETDWICVIDYDVMFLTPDAVKIMHEYVMTYSNTGIFTCYTNRIHPLAKDQLLGGQVSENDSIKHHQAIAKAQSIYTPEVTNINHVISGFLMLFSKSTWNKIKFREDGLCLGVDNAFSKDVLNTGRNILRMEGLYVWHSYRLNCITDKSHLKHEPTH